jgi:epsin
MMSEIADLTYNVVAFTEIMQMIWKRLNDHGKNWRHVYKALVLLEYLIKTGSEKVAQQCKENIYAIQTLKDFQYLDDNKDQGINVREKAKSLVALLKDDERLRNERVRALKAKERFAQSAAGIGSDTVYNATARERQESQVHRIRSSSPMVGVPDATELDTARPQTAGEEELQLQLALAMSREEAEQEESKSKSDDMRLQLALQKSKEEVAAEAAAAAAVSEGDGFSKPAKSSNSKPSKDLLDLDFGNPVAQPPPPQRTAASSSVDPWGMPVQQQTQPPQQQLDPWGASAGASAAPAVTSDPWSPVKEPPRVSPLPNLGPAPTNTMVSNDPWSPLAGGQDPSTVLGGNDAWGEPAAAVTASAVPATGAFSSSEALGTNNDLSIDPFSPMAQNQLSDFDLLRNEIEGSSNVKTNNGNGNGNGGTTSPNPFDLGDMGSTMPLTINNTGAKPKKSVNSLLGEHSNLVNLDNLVTDSKNQARNPFEHNPPNPFQATKVQKPAMNQLLQQQSTPWQQQPAAATSQQQDFNPFF